MSKARMWKDIPQYEGLYQISSDGEVYTTARQGSSGGIRSTHFDKFGYRRVTLTRNGKAKNYPIHTLVALTFLGDRPAGFHVCHADGDKLNNAVENLYYGTPEENSQDSVRHGTHNLLRQNYTGLIEKGEECSWSKLNDEKVRYIKSTQGLKSTRTLAKELSVTQGTISAVRTGKTWRHVE